MEEYGVLYCTIDDLVEAKDERTVIQLSNDKGVKDEDGNLVIDEKVVMLNIQKATNVINGYIALRYPAPLTGVVPPIIRNVCVDITIYNLYTRRNKKIEESDAVYLDYKNAMSILEKISKNQLSIPELQTAQGSSSPCDFRTNKTKKDRFFNGFTMRGFL